MSEIVDEHLEYLKSVIDIGWKHMSLSNVYSYSVTFNYSTIRMYFSPNMLPERSFSFYLMFDKEDEDSGYEVAEHNCDAIKIKQLYKKHFILVNFK